jgi:mannosyltransferase
MLFPSRTWNTRRIAVALGVTGFLVSFLGSWVPSVWGDEAASIISAERSWPSLLGMLRSVDAVHGSYYALLHVWIGIFGASPLSVRFPSAIAAGIVVAGTVVLASALFNTRVAVLAGLVCAVLPRMTYQGAEARTYVFDTAAIVWLTILIVHLSTTHNVKRMPWLAYAIGLAVCIYLFLFSALILFAHAAYLLSDASTRRSLRRWLQAVAVGIALAIPVIAFGIAERGQIAFLAHRTRITPEFVIVEQWFGNIWLALVCWGLIVAAAAFWWKGKRRARSSLALTIVWLVLPTIILVAGSETVVAMYTNRYLSFCAPVAAILVGAGIAALSRRWMRVATVLCVVALAAPSWYSQRTEFGKPGGSDWAEVSTTMATVASRGDTVIFDQSVKASWRPRLAMKVYPQGFSGLNDIALKTPANETRGLWDTVYPVSSLGPQLVGVRVVWALETTKSHESRADSDLSVLQRDGYTIVERLRIHRTIIYKLTRGGS